jgi:hypothetical protein
LSLSDYHRGRLTNILEQNKAKLSRDDVVNLVSQYKQKYGNPVGQSQDVLTGRPQTSNDQSQDQPQSQDDSNQPQPQHGDLWNLANSALNTNVDSSSGINNYIPNPIGILQGIGKGAISTGTNIAGIAGSVINALGGNVDWDLKNLSANNSELTETHGLSQGIGKFAEQTGELLLPAGEVAKAAKAVPLLGRMALQAFVGGAVGGIQSGSVSGEVSGALLGGTGELASAGISKILEPNTLKALGNFASKALGFTSQESEAAIKRAVTDAYQTSKDAQAAKASGNIASITKTPFMSAMRGDISMNDTANTLLDAVKNHADQASHNYQQTLTDIDASNSIPKSKATDIIDQAKISFLTKLQDFGLDKALQHPERWPADVDKDSIDQIYKNLKNWGNDPGDMTMLGLDGLKKNIISPIMDLGGKTASIASSVHDSIREGLTRELPEQMITPKVGQPFSIPSYSNMTKDYHDDMEFLRNIKSQLGAAPSGSDQIKVASKLGKLINDPNKDYGSILDGFSNGQQIKDELYGHSLNSFIPGKKAQWIPLGIEALGAMSHPAGIPMLALNAAVESPRLIGETGALAGRMAASRPSQFAGRALTSPLSRNIGTGILRGVIPETGIQSSKR